MRRVAAWVAWLPIVLTSGSAQQGHTAASPPSAAYFGQKPPGRAAERFAPEVLNSSGYHSVIVFSPDLKEAYWQASAEGARATDPRREGIMMSRLDNGRWTTPAPAAFSINNAGDDAPFVAPDGERIFFLSQRPVGQGGQLGPAKIWMVERRGGGWSEPECLASLTSSLAVHWQLSVDRRGDLYFGVWKVDPESGRTVEHDIYRAIQQGGRYGAPEKLGSDINDPAFRQYSPYIAPDGSYLIFTRVRKVNPAGPTLHLSFRRNDGGWTAPVVLNDVLRLPAGAGQATVSPDGRYLFFLRSGMEVFWVDAGFIEELRRSTPR